MMEKPGGAATHLIQRKQIFNIPTIVKTHLKLANRMIKTTDTQSKMESPIKISREGRSHTPYDYGISASIHVDTNNIQIQ